MSCGEEKAPRQALKKPHDVDEASISTTEKASSAAEQAPQIPIVSETIPVPDEVLPRFPSPSPPLVMPVFGGGGGGHGSRRLELSCENHTTDCNDKNPCTVDRCENDTCIHTLNESAICEQDGSSCTIGKCIQVGDAVQCFEQRREFITGEQGCQDDNQCTADSCVEIPLSSDEKTDKQGNVIPDNEHQCVHEITTGLLCSLNHACLRGFCQQTGSGMTPNDPTVVECVQDQAAIPVCPPSDNPCVENVCDVLEGCIPHNLPNTTSCNDNNICTANDACDGNGVCAGTAIDVSMCGRSPDPCRAFTCDPVIGCVLNANVSGSCNDSDPCTMGETCTAGVCGGGMAVTCPSDNNPCTDDLCKAGTGCVYSPTTQPMPTCTDNNACTTGDACVSGLCVGTLQDCTAGLDATCQIGFCDVTAGCQVIDLTGPFGDDCSTPFSGVCATGKYMCVEGSLTDPLMCEPLVRPGDKTEICFNGLDDDCDGEADEDCTLRAFMTSTTYSGDLVDAANGLATISALTDQYNCSADTYSTTPTSYTPEDDANNSGVEAADCLCRYHASLGAGGAGLRCPDGGFGCWKAWIADSTATSAPASRFTMAGGGPTGALPIYEVDSSGNADSIAPIAIGGWADLVVCGEDGSDPEGSLCLDDPGIYGGCVDDPAGFQSWRDELATRASVDNVFAWSNVLASGMQKTSFNCGSWTSMISQGEVGGAVIDSVSANGGTCFAVGAWTSFVTQACTDLQHLYCFEDP